MDENNNPTFKEQAREAVDKTVKTVKTGSFVVSKVGSMIATLFLPQTWIAILVTLILVVATIGTIATVQVLGRTENADGCFGIGSSSIKVSNGANNDENINNMIAYLETTNFAFLGNKSFPRNSAIGVGANGKIESMGDPAAVQPGQSHPEWTNDDLRKLGSQSGRAAGILQWDGQRRLDLIDFAEKNNGQWNDLSVQLEFLKHELDDKGEGARLAAAGWGNESGTSADKAMMWNKIFERSSDTTNHRQLAAEELEASYKGGNYVSKNNGKSGGSCLAGGSTSIDTSDVAKLAYSLSHPLGSTADNVSASDPYGKTSAKKEYIEAKKKAEDETSPDPMSGLYASCDRFVATVLRLTVDKDVPWGSTTEQQNYFSKSNKWEQFDKLSQAKPGDVFVTKTNGHIMLFLGEVDGQVLVAHASYLDRTAGLDLAHEVISDNLVDNGGRPYYGYHYVGDGK